MTIDAEIELGTLTRSVTRTRQTPSIQESRTDYATIAEIREGILGFVPSLMRHLHLPSGSCDH